MSKDQVEIQEKITRTVSGWIVAPLALIVLAIFALALVILEFSGLLLAISVAVLFAELVFVLPGFFILGPNEGVTFTFFGPYVGSVKIPGFHWTNPFYIGTRVSLKSDNFEIPKLKVNDKTGNPIEIGAVVVAKVLDTAKAVFSVDDYDSFIRTQADSALRDMAKAHPYDGDDNEVTLRGDTDKVLKELEQAVQERIRKAGVLVEEARLSHLAYAPEIAGPMLQKQQAAAVLAAREKIVKGSVEIIDKAFTQLAEKNITISDEKKADFAGKLLITMTSDKGVTPTLDLGE